MTAPNSLTAPVSTDTPGFPAILSLLISHQLSVGPGQGAHARVRQVSTIFSWLIDYKLSKFQRQKCFKKSQTFLKNACFREILNFFQLVQNVATVLNASPR